MAPAQPQGTNCIGFDEPAATLILGVVWTHYPAIPLSPRLAPAVYRHVFGSRQLQLYRCIGVTKVVIRTLRCHDRVTVGGLFLAFFVGGIPESLACFMNLSGSGAPITSIKASSEIEAQSRMTQ